MIIPPKKYRYNVASHYVIADDVSGRHAPLSSMYGDVKIHSIHSRLTTATSPPDPSSDFALLRAWSVTAYKTAAAVATIREIVVPQSIASAMGAPSPQFADSLIVRVVEFA